MITDEAHRSQYDIFAANMRAALPNAAFIGFTGTPLMAGEELTKEVFGEYVSVYNFKESVDDENTVPLYYENRIPEVQLVNDDLNEQMAAIPVTLYRQQWETLLGMADEIRNFIRENDSALKKKE